MSGWKQPYLLGKNKSELNACIMILETNKQEGEDFLYYSYKTNENCAGLLSLRGVILASVGIANSLFCDDYKVLILQDKGAMPNSASRDSKYKVCSKSYLKTYIVSVIMPFQTPDNVLIYTCQEFIEFLVLFFEKFEESTKFTDILNKYSEVLLFNSINYSLSKDKEDITSSPLSLMPITNLTFTYNESLPCFQIKPPINDNLRTEVIEIMNTLNSDRSVLQETLTLMDPPFYIRGFALLFKGFVLCNTLNNKEMSSLCRLAMLHEMYLRGGSSAELLSCEFLFENPDFDNPSFTLSKNNEDKRKILVTLLAQRDFVLLISLDILGKNNCSFDPFYTKRAEDLVISLLKKGYNIIINNELYQNSIKMLDDKNQNEEKILNDMDSDIAVGIGRKNSESSLFSNNKRDSKKKLPTVKDDAGSNRGGNNNNNNTSGYNTHSISSINSKIRGYIDIETKVNIIHFSCYDDSECVINTIDVNVSASIYKEIYKTIFREYARIQSNINKLKNRNKLLRLRKINQYENIAENYTNVLRKETAIKTKIQREKYLKNLKLFKINEYAVKMCVDSNIPIWICCKVYEHTNIEDEINLDEFANYKIIFATYESHSAVDLDSFCQDLLINELFI